MSAGHVNTPPGNLSLPASHQVAAVLKWLSAALQAQLQLTGAQRASLAAALQDRQTAMDLVARRRGVVAAELQAVAAAGDSDVGHIMLVQTVGALYIE